MKNNLKDIKEFIILLDVLSELVKVSVLTDTHQQKEMEAVLDALKRYIANGVLKSLEQIEEIAIIVDTVNGFMKEGALANRKAMHIVPKQIELIEKIIERNGLLVFVKEAHDENCTEFNIHLPHCIRDTWEAQLIDELKPYEQYGISIEKNSTNFMFGRGFQNLVGLMKNLKRVFGSGVLTDVCVPNGVIGLKTYFDQNNRDIDVIIPEDTIETFDAPNHNREEYTHAGKILMAQSGIKLVKTIKDIEWRRK